MENRVVEINKLITRIAMSNKDITSSQIARARAIYQSDPRPLEEIEKELLEYSAQISNHSKMPEGEMSSPSIDRDKINKERQSENISVDYTITPTEIAIEEPISSIPFDSHVEEENNSHENIIVDYTGDVGITPIGDNGFVPSSYVPDATFPRKSSSSSDLNMMFAEPGLTETKEKAKQFVKTTNTTKEAGFSSSIAILATAGMFSIITIALAIAILIF